MGLGAADSSGGAAGSPPSWGHRLAAEGCTSTGATMSVVAHRAPATTSSVSGGGRCSCGGGHGNCINIYVNSNVQGVANSVLVGSKVVMRDPGPRVSSRHHQPRRDGGRREGRWSSQQQQKAKTTTEIVGIVVAVAVVSLLFVAAAAATGLYLYPFVRLRQ